MFIIEEGKIFKVQTDVFETRAEAATVAKKLAAAGLDNFILKTERWVTPEGEEAPEEPTKPETPVLPPETDKKTIEALAKEVIEGKWGNGTERKERLTEAGYDYREVQNKVNELLKSRLCHNGKTDKIERKWHGKTDKIERRWHGKTDKSLENPCKITFFVAY